MLPAALSLPDGHGQLDPPWRGIRDGRPLCQGGLGWAEAVPIPGVNQVGSPAGVKNTRGLC